MNTRRGQAQDAARFRSPEPPRPMRKLAIAVLAAALMGTYACGDSFSSLAYGDYNAIVAVMAPDLWEEVRDDVYGALEPTIITVRDENTFNVTYQDPTREEWRNLRRFRQMLLVGSGEESWMKEAMAKAASPITGPGLYQVHDVWSRGQNVTLVITDPSGAAEAVRSNLATINAALDTQYRDWARGRMFLTGPDSALADTVMSLARFQVLVPKVYRWSYQDSTYIFRNDNPDPSELIRQISVSWITPIPPDMTGEGILEWRADIASTYYSQPQDVDLTIADAGPFEFRGRPAYRVQATWVNPPELNWPAAGPFITRAIICPEQNRMYLLDAWLYAPAKQKYEYMIQLETILDSFRCGPG